MFSLSQLSGAEGHLTPPTPPAGTAAAPLQRAAKQPVQPRPATAFPLEEQQVVVQRCEIVIALVWLAMRCSRPGAPTEPFVCLVGARYEGHEGERPMAWGNLCGGSSGRSRQPGCTAVVLHTSCCVAHQLLCCTPAVAWQCSGVGGLRG